MNQLTSVCDYGSYNGDSMKLNLGSNINHSIVFTKWIIVRKWRRKNSDSRFTTVQHPNHILHMKCCSVRLKHETEQCSYTKCEWNKQLRFIGWNKKQNSTLILCIIQRTTNIVIIFWFGYDTHVYQPEDLHDVIIFKVIIIYSEDSRQYVTRR